MRGVMTLVVLVFTLAAFFLVGPPAVEGVGEAVKDLGVLSASDEAIIDDLYTSLFLRIPLVLIFGFGAWAVAWYIRRQITQGQL